MFRTTTLRRSTSPMYAHHRVRSPANNRKQRHDHERCRPRAQIPWYVVKNMKIVEVAKAKKEIGTRVYTYVPVSVLLTVFLILLAPASQYVLSSIRSSCPQIGLPSQGTVTELWGNASTCGFPLLLLVRRF